MHRHKKGRYDLCDLRRASKPRQLSLDVYLRAYDRALAREVSHLIERDRSPDESEILWRRQLSSVHEQSGKAAISAGVPSWDTLRGLIYRRDKGKCWACGDVAEWDLYHLGHIVDRMVGGSDSPNNLAVMHAFCNMAKDLHPTRGDAELWRARGGAVGEVARLILSKSKEW